jgi:hypothetical protein
MAVWVQPLRPWLLVISVVLLVVGFAQLYVGKSACRRRSRLSVALLWIAVFVVVLVIIFPQVIASLLAG